MSLKYIKTVCLTVILVPSVSTNIAAFALPSCAEIKKNLCTYVALPTTVLIAMNSSMRKTPIEDYRKLIKMQGLSKTIITEALGTPLHFLLYPFEQDPYQINSVVIGGLIGVVGSLAGMYYFSSHGKAQKQPLCNDNNKDTPANPAKTGPANRHSTKNINVKPKRS